MIPNQVEDRLDWVSDSDKGVMDCRVRPDNTSPLKGEDKGGGVSMP